MQRLSDKKTKGFITRKVINRQKPCAFGHAGTGKTELAKKIAKNEILAMLNRPDFISFLNGNEYSIDNIEQLGLLVQLKSVIPTGKKISKIISITDIVQCQNLNTGDLDGVPHLVDAITNLPIIEDSSNKSIISKIYDLLKFFFLYSIMRKKELRSSGHPAINNVIDTMTSINNDMNNGLACIGCIVLDEVNRFVNQAVENQLMAFVDTGYYRGINVSNLPISFIATANPADGEINYGSKEHNEAFRQRFNMFELYVNKAESIELAIENKFHPLLIEWMISFLTEEAILIENNQIVLNMRLLERISKDFYTFEILNNCSLDLISKAAIDEMKNKINTELYLSICGNTTEIVAANITGYLNNRMVYDIDKEFNSPSIDLKKMNSQQVLIITKKLLMKVKNIIMDVEKYPENKNFYSNLIKFDENVKSRYAEYMFFLFSEVMSFATGSENFSKLLPLKMKVKNGTATPEELAISTFIGQNLKQFDKNVNGGK